VIAIDHKAGDRFVCSWASVNYLSFDLDVYIIWQKKYTSGFDKYKVTVFC
jgi:hypothetical protein